MLLTSKPNKSANTEAVDFIEKMLHEYLCPLGFKKFGRTFHRFTDSDISQVINLQNGCPSKGVCGVLWINLGIRVPECVEHKFTVPEVDKKYFHEYECNIRTTLGNLVEGTKNGYDLENAPETIGKDIIQKLDKYALPIFEAMTNRDDILANRRKYPAFDEMNSHLILLEEAMIFGRKGDLREAERLFNEYYKTALNKNKAHIEYLNTLAKQLDISVYQA